MNQNTTQVVISQYEGSLMSNYAGITLVGMKIGDRLRQARTLKGWSQQELADRSGVKQGAISKIERGDQDTTAFVVKLASALQVSPEWLESGAPGRGLVEPNTSSGPAVHRDVPVISWVQAGAWAEIIDNFAPGDAEEWLPVPRRVGPRAYILRVRGDSMTSPYPNGKSYPDGTLIVVDPDVQADSGSFVVVRLEDSQEATFKQLVLDGGRKYLKPLNPQYPTIEINGHATICGVVRGSMSFD